MCTKGGGSRNPTPQSTVSGTPKKGTHKAADVTADSRTSGAPPRAMRRRPVWWVVVCVFELVVE